MEKIFVALRNDYYGSGDQIPPLGFAAVEGAGSKTGPKKYVAQMEWAYGRDYENRDGIIFSSKFDQAHWLKYKLHQYVFAKAEYQPLTFVNEPRQGFKIEKTVSRSSTQNKLWRIVDPLGFQLEISTQNMAELLLESGVVHGAFIGSYKWDFGKNGIGKAKLVFVK